MEVINRIALHRNADTCHRVHFSRDGEMQAMPLAELDRRAWSVARRLGELGVRRGDRIGVMARNCVEWAILDVAILKLGAVTAGFEAGRFEPGEILGRYGLKLLFVDQAPSREPKVLDLPRVRAWADVAGEPPDTPLHDGYRPGDPCAVKFTSGSTGSPKGLDASVGSVDDSLTSVQEMFRHGDGDNLLVFLRQALLQQRYWLYSALVFGHDVSLSAMEQVLPAARLVRPTVIMGVPGFYDDVRARLEAQAATELLDPERRRHAIQDLLGGRIRYLWTGSAPAGRATLAFFNDCGVPLYEGYGLNETCIIAKNHPGAHRIGSVGKVLPNKTVRIDEDGVLVVGSRHPVSTRFSWCAPGDSERMFLPSGEVKTHDLGYFDADGYLYVLGRVDDIIALSSGRNVLVRTIEEAIKRHFGVHECVLYGNGKPFLTALVSPATEALDLVALDAHIQAMNETFLPEQRVRGVVVAKERFSIENHLLTSQWKPIRKEIYRHYESELEAVYRDGAPGPEPHPMTNPRSSPCPGTI